MPYVQRDHKGNIPGLYANPQPQPDGTSLTQPDPLPEDHPEVAEFRKKMEAIFGPPQAPPPLEDMQRIARDFERIEQEHKAIKAAVTTFGNTFTELEIALSALLYAVLNIRTSKVAYAIYFSPTSFDARAEIVDNALIQVISETRGLSDLLALWKPIHEDISPSQRLRNALAHGTQQTLSINGKSYARFSPLAFDVVRLGRPIAKRQIPGLTANDISQGAKRARLTCERVDSVNRIVTAFYDGDPAWREKLVALKASLTSTHSQ